MSLPTTRAANGHIHRSASHDHTNSNAKAASINSIPPSILFLSPIIISPPTPTYTSSVLVISGKIAQIAPHIEPPEGCRVVDARGHALCPGFIDMHAHSDLTAWVGGWEGKVGMGCTTAVIGQDGLSYAPVRNSQQLSAIRRQIAAWNGNPDETARDYSGKGLWQWRTVGEYLDRIEQAGVGVNTAMLVPQGNLRLLACGAYDTPATKRQLRDQVELLRQAMNDGAIGMSSGLTYTPGMYASTSELALLCRVLATEYPGSFYAPHHRSYGHQAMESYQEMLDLGKETGCPIHLTHATLNFPCNRRRAPELLSRIDQARQCGVDVTLDTYPYTEGCTTLAALLPSWATAGGPDETLTRLRDEALCERIRVELEVEGCDGCHGVPVDWESIEIGSLNNPSLAHLANRRISHIALDARQRPFHVFRDILTRDRLATSIIMHVGHEDNVRAMMQSEVHCGGTDGILWGKGIHPRAYGTFPRYLGHYSRDLDLIPLEEMIAHLTLRPAKRLGIYPHRGSVAMGSAADLVLFDPATIIDRATLGEPRRQGEGIRFVLVNGVVGVDEGVVTGRKEGKVLRRGSDGVAGEVSQERVVVDGTDDQPGKCRGTIDHEGSACILDGRIDVKEGRRFMCC